VPPTLPVNPTAGERFHAVSLLRMEGQRIKSPARFLAETVGMAVIYFCCGRFGLSLAFVNPSATAVWPPTGVALVTLLMRGWGLWPGVLLGAFFVNLSTQGSVATSLGIAAGNTLEAVLGVWLVNRYANGIHAFDQTATIFNFVFFAALGSTLVSATCGISMLCFGGLAQWSASGPIWLTWWLGDMVSDIILAPFLLVWLASPLPRLTSNQIGQAIGLLIVLVGIGEVVFMGNSFAAKRLPLEYLAIPPLLFSAFQFGQHGTLTSAFIMCGFALWGTLHGHGPFSGRNPNESLLLIQAFMGTITLTGVVLASIVAERRRSEAALHEAREELRTHAEELERRVKSRTATLQDTIQSLESLCYTIAHDLRGPLRAIAGYGDVLLDDFQNVLDQRGKEYLLRLKAAAKRMDRLILDLLQLGRVGSADVAAAEVKVEDIACRVLARLPDEIKTNNAQIRINQPLLPVRANQELLEQVLLNLFSNALKFSRPEASPHIELWTQALDNRVRICIRDNGVGIDAEHFDRIFQPFEKLDNHSSLSSTGIGLAIVRKGVERMGGRVGVESRPGAGSCFWLELHRAGTYGTAPIDESPNPSPP